MLNLLCLGTVMETLNDPLSDSSPLLYKKLSGLNYGDQPFLSCDSYYLWFKKDKPYTVKDLEDAFYKIKQK